MSTKRMEDWASTGHWTDWAKKPGYADLLFSLTTRACKALDMGETLTTSKIIDRAFPGLSKKGKSYVTLGLYTLRKWGRFDGFWIQGPKTHRYRTILWVSPETYAAMDGLEGLI